MIILFIDDENGHFSQNPTIYLVEVWKHLTKKEIKKAESNQIGVMRRGGNWQEILEYLNTDYLLLEKNRLDDWEYKKHDIKYKVISGNY